MRHALLTFALGLALCGTVAASLHPRQDIDQSRSGQTDVTILENQELRLGHRWPDGVVDYLPIDDPGGAVILAYSDPLQSDFLADSDMPEMSEELHDLYIEQIMDMQRAIDLLSLQLQLGDVLIDAQKEQILGLENSLESVKRLADARVDAEKARCPKCLKPWLQWTTRGLAFAVGGAAGRGSCDFGN